MLKTEAVLRNSFLRVLRAASWFSRYDLIFPIFEFSLYEDEFVVVARRFSFKKLWDLLCVAGLFETGFEMVGNFSRGFSRRDFTDNGFDFWVLGRICFFSTDFTGNRFFFWEVSMLGAVINPRRVSWVF